MPGTRLVILVAAIAAPTLCFAATWLQTEACTLIETAEIAPAMRPTADTVCVELDVFSGRPNPEWEVTGAEASNLLTLLGRLVEERAVHKEKLQSSPLGYRGLTLTAIHGRIRRTWRIANSEILSDDKVFADTRNVIEMAALATMPVELRATLGPVLPK